MATTKDSQNSIGEPILEPEVDITTLLERQKLDEASGPVYEKPVDDDDVDHTIAPTIGSGRHIHSDPALRKGKIQTVEWDEELEELKREKAAFEATRGGITLPAQDNSLIFFRCYRAQITIQGKAGSPAEQANYPQGAGSGIWLALFPIPSLRIPLISRRSERLHQRTSIAYRNQGSERRERTDGRLLGRLARLARAKLRRLTYIRIYTDDTCVHMLCTSTLDLCICARSLYMLTDSIIDCRASSICSFSTKFNDKIFNYQSNFSPSPV